MISNYWRIAIDALIGDGDDTLLAGSRAAAKITIARAR